MAKKGKKPYIRLIYEDEAFDLGLPREDWKGATFVLPIATPRSLILVVGQKTIEQTEPQIHGIYMLPLPVARQFLRHLDRIRKEKPTWFSGPN